MPERRIYAQLAGSTGVTGRLASSAASIKPMATAQAAARPCITYQRISTVPVVGSTGHESSMQARLQLDIWSDTYVAAKQIATAAREALRGFQSSGPPVIDMTHLDSEQDFDEPVEPGQDERIYRVSQDYLVDFVTT